MFVLFSAFLAVEFLYILGILLLDVDAVPVIPLLAVITPAARRSGEEVSDVTITLNNIILTS